MKKLSIAIVLMIAVASLAFMSCGGGGGGGGGGGTTTTSLRGLASCTAVADEAVICGTAYAPDGQTPISGAEVSLVVSASENATLRGLYKAVEDPDQCLTDDAGGFACAGTTSGGEQTYQVSGQGYTFTFSQDVTVGTTTTVDSSKTTAPSSSGTDKYAVVEGSFDSIENVLARLHSCGTVDTDGVLQVGTECDRLELVGFWGTNPNTVITSALGLSAGTYPTQDQFLKDFLATATNRAQFKAIFLNCGGIEWDSYSAADLATIVGNLQSYVSEGGTLYASDWMYGWIEEGWPTMVDWYGDDTISGDAKVAWMNPAQTVNILDSGLLTWLRAEGLIAASATTFDVNFNLSAWVLIVSVDSSVTQILTADNLPNGLDGVTPYNPGSPIPISILFSYGSGCAFYTSYHNEDPGDVGKDAIQTRVLEYMVFNRLGNCQ